jgi:putative transposase
LPSHSTNLSQISVSGKVGAVHPSPNSMDVSSKIDFKDREQDRQTSRGYPKRSKTHNASEFTSLHYEGWAYERGIAADYSRRGTPTDNAIIERFNGSLRDEGLGINWLLSHEDALEKTEQWRKDYNTFRPQSSLNDLMPNDYADRLRAREISQAAGTTFG